MKQFYIASYFRTGYSWLMQYVRDFLDHPKRESIERRLEIIQFFEEFGTEATRRAFGKSRSTIYLWKQKLRKAGGKLSALAPGNKTPIHKRKRTVHPFIERFIIEYRAEHPGVDKITIFQKPIEAHCRSDAELYAEVSSVLKHEIAHHFGTSEARLREIERG